MKKVEEQNYKKAEKEATKALNWMIQKGDLTKKIIDGKEYYAPTEQFEMAMKAEKEFKEQAMSVWKRIAKVGTLWMLTHGNRRPTKDEYEKFAMDFRYTTEKELDRLIQVEKDKGHRLDVSETKKSSGVRE